MKKCIQCGKEIKSGGLIKFDKMYCNWGCRRIWTGEHQKEIREYIRQRKSDNKGKLEQ